MKTATRLNAQHRDYLTAKAVLEENPNDSDAHLTIGRWACFVLDDWTSGLPHLAECRDPSLVEAATRDLAVQHEAGDLAAVGDAWWDLAADRPAQEVIALKLRAVYWYELAAQQQELSLTSVRLEQRISEGRLLDRPFKVGHMSPEQPATEAWRRPSQ